MSYQFSDDQKTTDLGNHDNISTSNSVCGYRYTFAPESSNGGQGDGKKNGFFKGFLTVVLCVCLSIGAGYGGAMLYGNLNEEPEQSENGIYDAPEAGGTKQRKSLRRAG